MIKTIETSTIWNGGEISKDMYAEVQQAMVTSAERIADRAQGLVPIGPGIPKHLKDTIRAKGRRKKSRAEILVHGIATGDYALETALPGAWVFAGEQDAGVYWAHFVEYGTYESEAHPFLRPAVDENFNAAVAETEHAAQRAINKRRRRRAATRRAAQR